MISNVTRPSQGKRLMGLPGSFITWSIRTSRSFVPSQLNPHRRVYKTYLSRCLNENLCQFAGGRCTEGRILIVELGFGVISVYVLRLRTITRRWKPWRSDESTEALKCEESAPGSYALRPQQQQDLFKSLNKTVVETDHTDHHPEVPAGCIWLALLFDRYPTLTICD